MIQSEEHVLRIKETVKLKLEHAMKKHGPGLVNSWFAELCNAWMLQNYYVVVEFEVASGVDTHVDDAVATSSMVAAIDFKPEISVSELNDEEARKRPKLVLSKVQTHTTSRIYKQEWAKRH